MSFCQLPIDSESASQDQLAEEPSGELPLPLAGTTPVPPSFTRNFPFELFYHLAERCSRSTLSKLCCVSTSIRAVASPQLYNSMSVLNASQFRPFLPDPTSPLAPLDRSLTLDKVISLYLLVPYGHFTSDSCTENTFPPIHLPNLLRLTLQSQRHDLAAPPSGEPIQSLFLAQDLLSHLNPRTLNILPDIIYPDEHYWAEQFIPTSVWRAISLDWTRLSSVRVINCACYCWDQADRVFSFFPGSQAASVFFSWELTGEVGSYATVTAELKEGSSESMLESLRSSEVFEHPSVRERGLELVIGDRHEDRVAFEEDLGGLEENCRSLVRSR